MTQPEPSTASRGHFLCESCVSFHHQPGMCPSCPDEPLVNVRDEHAMDLIRSREQHRHLKRVAKFTIGSILIMLPIHGALVALSLTGFYEALHYAVDHNLRFLPALFLAVMCTHVVAFGVSVMWLERVMAGRFSGPSIVKLIDGEDPRELDSRRLRDHVSNLWAHYQGWKY